MKRPRPTRPRRKPAVVPAPPLSVTEQAAGHRDSRLARASQVAEDYVEVIGDLIASEGEARVVDVARRLGVTHVTVNRTVARLRRDDLVTAAPYRSIFLTKKGSALADHVRRRHVVVLSFLRAIGVPEEAARVDAEGMEHHVSSPTLAALERFLSSRR